MTSFFNCRGETYSLADIRSVGAISTSDKSAFFTISLGQDRDRDIEVYYCNDTKLNSLRYAENPLEKATKTREGILQLWGEFKKQIPNIGQDMKLNIIHALILVAAFTFLVCSIVISNSINSIETPERHKPVINDYGQTSK